MSHHINRLLNYRKAILFIEIAGLLHDIGKLSKKFLEYRLTWQNDPNGWGNDPHDNHFLEQHETSNLKAIIEKCFKATFDSLLQQVGFINDKDFTIWKAINEHTKRDVGDIMKLLQAADAVDSIIDRNNPFWSAEQKEVIYSSNVFGYESGRIVNPIDQDIARKELYHKLTNLLKDYFDPSRGFTFDQRNKILITIKDAFEQGLSDTTRPQNDTTLREHSYAVASILKALVAHYIITGELLDGMEDGRLNVLKVQFRILGMGWDGLRFMSYGYKIGDLVGRKKVLEEIKEKAREVVEWKYALGNEVYADDDGIYFIVPKCMDNKSEFTDIVIKTLISVAVDCSGGELQPYFSLSGETFTTTSLVSVIGDIRNKSQFPFIQAEEKESSLKHSLNKLRSSEIGIVCSICRLRPVKERDDKERICATCLDRRKTARSDIDLGDRKHTIFVDELTDQHGRVAAIVARFNLDNWLNGRMVRTMFVTEAQGIDREINQLGTVKEKRFEKGEEERRTFFDPENNPPNYNYGKIIDDIKLFFSNDLNDQKARQVAILYDRRNDYSPDLEYIRKRWQQHADEVSKELGINIKNTMSRCHLLANILCAKTPTPSTILDVWDTTKGFFQKTVEYIIENESEERKRLKLILKPGFNPNAGRGTVEAILTKGNRHCEILPLSDGNVEVIGVPYSDKTVLERGNDLKIDGRSYKIEEVTPGRAYRQCRTLTISPNLFISLVPAEKAVSFASDIYKEYHSRFGKAMGRLPFSIGAVFFDRPMPMFIVLDTIKRMVVNFDALAQIPRNLKIRKEKRTNGTMTIDMIDTTDNLLTVRWSLPLTLGNCESDNHHCYVMLAENHNATDRKTYFPTIAGDVVHFSELKGNDTIKAYSNYFDFIYLDSNARRYDVMIEAIKRTKSSVDEKAALPVLLDELDQKIRKAWNVFLKGKGLQNVTDTKIRNLRSLWSIKRQEWGINGAEQWSRLIRGSLFKEFGLGSGDEAYMLLEEMMKSGLLFETLDLYMNILKERIDK